MQKSISNLHPSYSKGGRNHHLLSENRYFSRTKPPLDLSPVCKFKFVHCGPAEKNRALYLPLLALYIHIYAPVKTEFAKSIKMVDFSGRG